MGKNSREIWPLEKSSSQDLSAAKLDVTTSFGKKWRLSAVYIHFDAACSQDVTIKRDSGLGANYDTVIKEETLSSATDFVFRPTGKEIYDDGDELNVQVSTGGSATAYLEIKGEEI